MATTLADAFERAGLPTGAVAFASACRDLAVLALNKSTNPKIAMTHWLGMASAEHGFRMALTEYLESIAVERRTKSVEDKDQAVIDTHALNVPPSTDTPTGDERDHGQHDTLAGAVPSSLVPASEGGDHAAPDTRSPNVTPLAPRVPSIEQIRAVTDAKARSARVMSGIYLTERQGNRTPIEDITIGSLSRRLKWHGRRVAISALEYNTLWLINQRIGNQNHLSNRTPIGDLLSNNQLVRMHRAAQAYAHMPMVQLPEQLRQELADL